MDRLSDIPFVALSNPSSINNDEGLSDEGGLISQTAFIALQRLEISLAELKAQNIPLKQLNDFICKELSCSHHLRWASIDNISEKLLQHLAISKLDINPKIKGCLKQMKLQMPHGRSILLQRNCGLRKVETARGFVRTTEQVLMTGIHLFIAIGLSYRLYELCLTGTFDTSEIKAVFQANSVKGITSLVRLLAKVDKGWLKVLLASPVIGGALKGVSDGCQYKRITQDTLSKFQRNVGEHVRPFNGFLQAIQVYAWEDSLRQLIPIPGYPSVSDLAQKGERSIRWDGSISIEDRGTLFNNIEQLALQGRGISKLNAMLSLAKIVHSLSIKDFAALQEAGYSKEILIEILKIKAHALGDLQALAAKNPSIELKRSRISRLYASYLIWWLGMEALKPSLVFWTYKGISITLQILFIKEIINSILEAIDCPDKPGFKMFYGYEIWANELSLDCFREFVRQFRVISLTEPIGPFLDQIQNFHLEGLDTINLSAKSLTSVEVHAILEVLSQKTTIKYLNITGNLVGTGGGVVFPEGLLWIALGNNVIGDFGTKGLEFPQTLQTLYLPLNFIDPNGTRSLSLPHNLKILDLSWNQIGDEGAKDLILPQGLQELNLFYNEIGDEGAKGLRLSSNLQSLNLAGNKISDEGVKGLHLPQTLKVLSLGSNVIGDEGIKGLQLPQNLESLVLSWNEIGDAGIMGLQWPQNLSTLYLGYNKISSVGIKYLKLPQTILTLGLENIQMDYEGAKSIQLPENLQKLYLRSSQITDEAYQALVLPQKLQYLDLGFCDIGPLGIKSLKLPQSLQTLILSYASLGSEGSSALQLPQGLQYLDLWGCHIGDGGAIQLKFPENLNFLNLCGNLIGEQGAKGLRLPQSLQKLILSDNLISSGADLKLPPGLQELDLSSNVLEFTGLQLPQSLQRLDLSGNCVAPGDVKGLILPQNLLSVNLGENCLGPEEAKVLKFPPSLQELDLGSNHLDASGAKVLVFPQKLRTLNLGFNQIGDEGVKGLQLPQSLQILELEYNGIGDEGIRALLKKIPQTNLTSINLRQNKYNSSILNEQRVLQRQILIGLCQDKLCHANTPLEHYNSQLDQQMELKTSSAMRNNPFFSWLNKPLRVLAQRINGCVAAILDTIGTSLRVTVSNSPSYFPNIHSFSMHDHYKYIASQYRPQYLEAPLQFPCWNSIAKPKG